MSKTITLGDISKINKDIEVCRTTNKTISNQAAQLLIDNQIPFTKDWVKIPFFQREKYRGARQFYIIRTNRNRYGQARRTIDEMDEMKKQKIQFSNY